MTRDTRFIRWFSELGVADVPLVGGKNASLGEMYRELEGQGIRVPNGFAVTADAYRHTLAQGDAWQRLQASLDGLDASDLDDLARRASLAREIVYGAELPPDLAAQIRDAYRVLVGQYGADLTVAVRSSATAEDLPTASFAGQHETFLNIAGAALLRKPVQGARHHVPHRERLRPFQGAAVGRHHEDGALRPRLQRRRLLARHRERIPRRGADQRRLWPR
jgi:pyruvate,water dikinase